MHRKAHGQGIKCTFGLVNHISLLGYIWKMANGHNCNKNEHKWRILSSFDHIARQKIIALTKEHVTIRVFTLIRMLESRKTYKLKLRLL